MLHVWDGAIYAVAIGISVGAFLYLGVVRSLMPSSAQRAAAVGSFGFGFLCTWWLYRHPWVIDPIAALLVDRGTLLLVAAVTAAVMFWKFRVWFTK